MRSRVGIKPGIRKIAEALGRHRTTIVRELERNRSQQAYLWCGYDIWQRAKYADESAKKRQKRSHKRMRLKCQEIKDFGWHVYVRTDGVQRK
ncbi:helix-turn-helix domain-containing protein [bacterium]|nr:helix-turn-helix domain-containing protein [bacterium]